LYFGYAGGPIGPHDCAADRTRIGIGLGCTLNAGGEQKTAEESHSVNSFFIAARSSSFPRMYTFTMRRVFRMFSNGFASRTTKSALLPAAIVPSELAFTIAAEVLVAAVMTCAGVIPA